MQTKQEAKATLAKVVKPSAIGPYVGRLGTSHVYVIAPSRRAVVSERVVTVYSPAGKAEPKQYTVRS